MKMRLMLPFIPLLVLVSCGAQPSVNSGGQSEDASAAFYDLVEAGKLLAYGMMLDIKMSPENYLGATLRVGGFYDYAEAEDESLIHSIGVNDVTGCCTEYMEFVLAEGTLPEVGAHYVVTGTYASYQTSSGTRYHLIDAIGVDE